MVRSENKGCMSRNTSIGGKHAKKGVLLRVVTSMMASAEQNHLLATMLNEQALEKIYEEGRLD